MDKQQTLRQRWGHLWQLAKGSRHYYLLGIAAMVGAVFFTFMIPLVLSFAVDSVIGTKPIRLPAPLPALVEALGGRAFLRGNLWALGLLVLAFSLGCGVFSYLQGRWLSQGVEGMAASLRSALFSRISHAPFAWHKSVQTGDLVQRCTTDVEQTRMAVRQHIPDILRSFLMMGIALSIMWPLSHRLTLTACILLPLLVVSSFGMSRWVAPRYRKLEEADGTMTSALQENLTGMRVVRAFARQQNELEKFTRLNRKHRDIYRDLSIPMGFVLGISEFLSYAQITLVTITGMVMAINGSITLGTMLLFNTYCTQFTFSMRRTGRIFSRLIRCDVGLKRLEEVLCAPQEAEPGQALAPTLHGQVQFEDVSFAYAEGDPVLQHISFTAQAGQTIGILGSTGSGKSTLVQLMQRLFLPTEGRILLDGTDLWDIRADALRSQVGIVLQEPFLFSRTIAENIAIARPDLPREELESAARTACIHDVVLQFTDGYDTLVGERGVTLSGGQKQRVAIARMLVQQAPICIFDDSLSAVDAETDAAIRTALRQRDTGTTFLISHRIATLRDADLILVLENGQIVQRGTHAQLQAQDGLYRRICTIQNELDAPLTKEVTCHEASSKRC